MNKTSWQVKAKYNKKTYKNFSTRLKPDLYNEFEGLRKSKEMSKPEFINDLIKVYKENIKNKEGMQ